MSKTKSYIVGTIVLLTYWDLAAQHALISEIFLPAPQKVFVSLWSLFTEDHLGHDILMSSRRILLSFLLSTAVAIPTALALNRFKRQKEYLMPFISFFRYIPTSALVPLFILWLGIGEAEKIWLIFMAVAPYMAMLTLDVIDGVKKEYIETAKTMGASERDIMLHVIIPHSLPQIWNGARFMLGAAWSLLIMAEIVGANSGLGYLITIKQRFVRTDAVIGLILLIGFIGIAIDAAFERLRPILFPWTQKHYARTPQHL